MTEFVVFVYCLSACVVCRVVLQPYNSGVVNRFITWLPICMHSWGLIFFFCILIC